MIGCSTTSPTTTPPTSIPQTTLLGHGPPERLATFSSLATSDPVAALLIRTLKSQAAWAKANCEINQAKRAAEWAEEATKRAAECTAARLA